MSKQVVIENISKEFSVGKKKFYAVKDVSITVDTGQCLGIVGESGSGKSTLAKMIIGTLRPTCGEILIDGVDFLNLPRKEKRKFQRYIQMVYQDPISSFSPRMNIGDYICEPRINYDGISKSEAMIQAKQLLKEVEIPEEFLTRLPHQLSGGQLQRVAIARALAISPKILICDEATSALDVSIQKQILNLLMKLKNEHKLTTIFICHDLAVVKSICDKVIVMYNGELMETIDSNDIVNKSTNPYTKQLLAACYDVYADRPAQI